MKYITKEIYETMQKTSLHLSIKASKKAEAFSEEYYRKLYSKEEKLWLEWEKEMSEFDPEKELPENIAAEMKASGAGFDTQPFDPVKGRNNFRRSQKNIIEYLKNYLPREILDKTADIRVLALDYASAEVKKDISDYCRRNKRIVDDAFSAYQREHKKQFRSGMPEFVQKLYLHDCDVISCRRKNKDIVLTVDNSGGFTNICEVRFKNCTVIKQDAPLHGAWCLYEEIYKVGTGFELHFLLQKKELIDYIVSAEDVELRYI